jgi:hypothetical protein
MNDPTNKGADSELGILARRKIEAAIIAPIYDEMRQAIGEDKARDILRRAIRCAAINAGAEMAERAEGGADLESFKAILPLWTKDGPSSVDEGRRVDDRGHRRCAGKARLQRQALPLRGDLSRHGTRRDRRHPLLQP